VGTITEGDKFLIKKGSKKTKKRSKKKRKDYEEVMKEKRPSRKVKK